MKMIISTVIGLALAPSLLVAMEKGKSTAKPKAAVRFEYALTKVLPAAVEGKNAEQVAQLEAFSKNWQNKKEVQGDALKRHKAFRKALKKALRADYLVNTVIPMIADATEAEKAYVAKWAEIARNAQDDVVAKFVEAAIESIAVAPIKETIYKDQAKELRKAIKRATRLKTEEKHSLARAAFCKAAAKKN